MKVFLRMSVVLVLLAIVMSIVTIFEFKDNHLTYRKPTYKSQPVDNDSNNSQAIKNNTTTEQINTDQ